MLIVIEVSGSLMKKARSSPNLVFSCNNCSLHEAGRGDIYCRAYKIGRQNLITGSTCGAIWSRVNRNWATSCLPNCDTHQDQRDVFSTANHLQTNERAKQMSGLLHERQSHYISKHRQQQYFHFNHWFARIIQNHKEWQTFCQQTPFYCNTALDGAGSRPMCGVGGFASSCCPTTMQWRPLETL